jgi:hypothetical protein
MRFLLALFFALSRARSALEHVPKKLLGFFDQNVLQLFESERVLSDQLIPSDLGAL